MVLLSTPCTHPPGLTELGVLLLQTYYLPAIARPLSFLRGLVCMFGDQTLFCRAADFRAVGGYDPELPIMEDVDLCIRLHEAGPSSYRSGSPIGKHPLTAAPTPKPSHPRERALGTSSRGQSGGDGATLIQDCGSCAEDRSSDIASSSADPQPLRQRRQPQVAAPAVEGGKAAQPQPSRLVGWLAALKVWAASHCRHRGRVRMEWWPVAHTSGRRLEAWGNFKVTSPVCAAGRAWPLGPSSSAQLVQLSSVTAPLIVLNCVSVGTKCLADELTEVWRCRVRRVPRSILRWDWHGIYEL